MHWTLKEIYLYLKNIDSVKRVKSFVKCAIHLFQPMQIYQLPSSFLKAQVSFPSNFASIFSAIKHNSSVLFLAQTLYSLVKGSNKRASFLHFRVFESKFVKFLMSILKWQVNSSSNFASFFIVMTHNSTVNFKLIHFLLWTKGSHQSSNFDTFNCSGENLPNSSCHLPNHKSVFHQILHHSSVSWKITCLYFF